MPIHVICEGCSKEYNVKDEMAGKKMRCKECSAVIAVPSQKAGKAKSTAKPDLDEYAFDAEDEPEEMPLPSRAKSASKNKAAKPRKKSNSSGNGRLVAILSAVGGALVLCGLAVAFWLLPAIRQQVGQAAQDQQANGSGNSGAATAADPAGGLSQSVNPTKEGDSLFRLSRGQGVFVSPDGSIVATVGSGISEIRVWDFRSGSELARPQNPQNAVAKMIAISADNTLLAATGHAGLEKSLRVWQIESGKVLYTIKWAALLGEIAFSPDKKSIYSMVANRGFYIIDLETGTSELVAGEEGDRQHPFGGTFLPEKQIAALFVPISKASRIVHVTLYDIQTKQKTMATPAPDTALRGAFSANGKYLAVSGFKTSLYEVDNWSNVVQFDATGGQIADRLAVTSDGKHVVLLDDLYSTLVVRDIETSVTRTLHKGRYLDFDMTPDGTVIVIGATEPIRMFDVKTGEARKLP